MTAHEIVIRFGRPFDIRVGDRWVEGVREITVPFTFGDATVAESALADMSMTVRQVNDAGGEDYRPVVAGEVLHDRDAEHLLAVQTERMRAVIAAPKPDLGDVQGDLDRDFRDLAELGRIARGAGDEG